MRSAVAVAAPVWLRQSRTRIAWPHPEWWVLGMSAAAWLAIVVSPGSGSFDGQTMHVPHAALTRTTVVTGIRDWIVMVVAMMLPLSVGSMRATAARSLWRRRHRAIACWLLGYLSVWALAGVAASIVIALFVQAISAASLAALAFVAAAGWQTTEVRARALSRCHRTQPLAPTGWRATYDCVRYGWSTGVNCVASCGLLMLATAALGHSLPGILAMAAITVIGLAERNVPRPHQRRIAAAFIWKT